MATPKTIAVAGGGIGGLHFACAAARKGFKVTVLERTPYQEMFSKKHVGGGLGLWPPSLEAMESIDALRSLEQVGAYMPPPAYQSKTGDILAAPGANFSSRFPILCVKREELLRSLHSSCLKSGVEFLEGAQFEDYTFPDGANGKIGVLYSMKADLDTPTGGDGSAEGRRGRKSKEAAVSFDNVKQLEVDLLVGADGIHSRVRGKMLSRHPTSNKSVQPVHCGYAYFRANTAVEDGVPHAAVRWHDEAFEAWGNSQRFGYVPLQRPEVFWFASVPIGPSSGLSPLKGAQRLDADAKEWLLSRFQHWSGPKGTLNGDSNNGQQQTIVDIHHLVSITPPNDILRTDIQKVPSVCSFSWAGEGGRIVLLGDACHATAPNLAQGAGLSIEDGVLLADLLSQASTNPQRFHSLLPAVAAAYQKERKPRAWAVQTLADTVAAVGQLGIVAPLRNLLLTVSRLPLLRFASEFIFQATVRYSLGGHRGRLYWIPSTRQTTAPTLPRTLGWEPFHRLPTLIREARSNPGGCCGSGVVEVRTPQAGLLKLFASAFGLPESTQKPIPFLASVSATGQWTRVFGDTSDAESTVTYYSTQHTTCSHLGSAVPTGTVLCESVGVGRFAKHVQFMYRVTPIETANEDGVSSSAAPPRPSERKEIRGLRYESIGLRVFGLRFTSRTAAWTFPQSQWTETFTSSGWDFDGTISFPKILGGAPLMKYKGSFALASNKDDRDNSTLKRTGSTRATAPVRVIVTGGTGLVGGAVLRRLVTEERFPVEVIALTRSPIEAGRVIDSPSALADFVDNADPVENWRSRINPGSSVRFVHWDAKSGEGWDQWLTQDCVVLNLAGENPGQRRWTSSVKSSILASRLGTIQAIETACSTRQVWPKVLLQASAVGIYGQQSYGELYTPLKEEVVDPMQKIAGLDFRAECCREIERRALVLGALSLSSSVANGQGTCVLNARLGHVLSAAGGLYPWIQLGAKTGLHGIGSGEQKLPWIHVTDAAELLVQLALHHRLGKEPNSTPPPSGAYNIVAGSAPQSQLFAGARLTMPWQRQMTASWFKFPESLFRVAFGESSSVLLQSHFCSPEKAIQVINGGNGTKSSPLRYGELAVALKSWECQKTACA